MSEWQPAPDPFGGVTFWNLLPRGERIGYRIVGGVRIWDRRPARCLGCALAMGHLGRCFPVPEAGVLRMPARWTS